MQTCIHTVPTILNSGAGWPNEKYNKWVISNEHASESESRCARAFPPLAVQLGSMSTDSPNSLIYLRPFNLRPPLPSASSQCAPVLSTDRIALTAGYWQLAHSKIGTLASAVTDRKSFTFTWSVNRSVGLFWSSNRKSIHLEWWWTGQPHTDHFAWHSSTGAFNPNGVCKSSLLRQ